MYDFVSGDNVSHVRSTFSRDHFVVNLTHHLRACVRQTKDFWVKNQCGHAGLYDTHIGTDGQKQLLRFVRLNRLFISEV